MTRPSITRKPRRVNPETRRTATQIATVRTVRARLERRPVPRTTVGPTWRLPVLC